jgi:hypothetical protein
LKIKKTIWIICALILIVLIIGFFYFNSINKNLLREELNQNLSDRYPAINNNQFYQKELASKRFSQ